MKIALGMLTKDEKPMLEKTLIYKALSFQHKFAVDFYSGDYTVELLGSFGVHVHSQVWKNNFAFARNVLIQVAEEAGMDYLFMLDADEAMNEDAINLCISYAQKGHKAISLPRIEMVKDFHHYDPSVYPDVQCRFFKLNEGFFFRNKLHEMLHDPNTDKPVMSDRSKCIFLPTAHIFHYSKTNVTPRLALKYINYDRMAQGLPNLNEIPKGWDIEKAKFWQESMPYLERHPLEKL